MRFMLVSYLCYAHKHKSHVSEHTLSQYKHPVTYISYWYVNIPDSEGTFYPLNFKQKAPFLNMLQFSVSSTGWRLKSDKRLCKLHVKTCKR